MARWAHETQGMPINVKSCRIASRWGLLEGLKYVRGLKKPPYWGEETCEAAATGGHLELLKWARSQGAEWGPETCSQAASHGHLDILKYARDSDPQCPWTRESVWWAAQYGHLEVLKWLFSCSTYNSTNFSQSKHDNDQEQKPNSDSDDDDNKADDVPNAPRDWFQICCNAAAWGGQHDVLRWARNQTPKLAWNRDTSMAAARHGQLRVVKWIHKKGCHFGPEACTAAAANGHLSVLKWMMKDMKPECKYNIETLLYEAFKREHFETLNWLETQV
jgi:hypothetical protein